MAFGDGPLGSLALGEEQAPANAQFTHPGRLALQSVILDAWQPPAWPYEHFGAGQFYARTNLNPSLLNSFGAPPPVSHPERSGAYLQANAAQQWQPPAWPHEFLGAAQPYAPATLPPSITNVPVNDPPYGHPERSLAGQAVRIAITAAPDPWIYDELSPWQGQPYGPAQMSPAIPGLSHDPVPFVHPEQTPQAATIRAQWQPPEWPHEFLGNRQAYAGPQLSPAIPGQSADPPPFRSGLRNPELARIAVQAAQPDPWTYTYLGGDEGGQPYGPRQLPESLLGQRVDNPPVRRQEWTATGISIVHMNQPPAWPYQFMGKSQPYDGGEMIASTRYKAPYVFATIII